LRFCLLGLGGLVGIAVLLFLDEEFLAVLNDGMGSADALLGNELLGLILRSKPLAGVVTLGTGFFLGAWLDGRCVLERIGRRCRLAFALQRNISVLAGLLGDDLAFCLDGLTLKPCLAVGLAFRYRSLGLNVASLLAGVSDCVADRRLGACWVGCGFLDGGCPLFNGRADDGSLMLCSPSCGSCPFSL